MNSEMASELERADDTYVELWRKSMYLNVSMLQYILAKMWPEEKCPWHKLFEICEEEVTKFQDGDSPWDTASLRL
jgi:hypothetical protein